MLEIHMVCVEDTGGRNENWTSDDDFYIGHVEFKVVTGHLGRYGQQVISYLYLELRREIWGWVKNLSIVFVFLLGST